MKKQDISFNEAVARIEEIVKSIESGEPDIDKLSGKVKEASGLIKLCKEKLRETEKKIEEIISEE
jgi:exodeoxyribonuclease VII small subunit